MRQRQVFNFIWLLSTLTQLIWWYLYLKNTKHLVRRASLVYETIVRFLRDFYETILVEKFPSREISEKCAGRRSRLTFFQSFLLFYRTQCNVRILAVVSLSVAETRRRWRKWGCWASVISIIKWAELMLIAVKWSWILAFVASSEIPVQST